MTVQLRWKPLISGDLYCSPACGCGCTKAEYDEAVKLAGELAKRMGTGWKPEVWENGTWNYAASKGIAWVHTSLKYVFGVKSNCFSEVESYWISIGTNPQFCARDVDPVKALQRAESELKEHIELLMEQLEELKK